jgi:hypothetical protein
MGRREPGFDLGQRGLIGVAMLEEAAAEREASDENARERTLL